VYVYYRIKNVIDARTKDFMDVDVKQYKKELKRSPVNLDALGSIDPSKSACLKRFEPAKRGSNCLFAKQSKLWGSLPWDSSMSIEENVKNNMVTLEVFTEAGRGLHLDGFLFEVRFFTLCERKWNIS
jgi:hypothetical protein